MRLDGVRAGFSGDRDGVTQFLQQHQLLGRVALGVGLCQRSDQVLLNIIIGGVDDIVSG